MPAKTPYVRVPTSHLPKDLRQALREAGIRPQRKLCFQNCQRLMLVADRVGIAERLRYVEGIVTRPKAGGFPFKHAWVRLDGKDADLTVDNAKELQVVEAYEASPEEVALKVMERGCFEPLDLAALKDIIERNGLAGMERLGKAIAAKYARDNGFPVVEEIG